MTSFQHNRIFSLFKHLYSRSNSRVWSLGLLVLLTTALSGQLFPHSFLGRPVSQIILISTSAVVSLMMAILFRIEKIRPMAQLAMAGHDMVRKEFGVITGALSELAQGNLSIQLTEQVEFPELPDADLPAEFIGVLADMARYLEEAMGEFNVLTETPCLRLCYVGADSFLEGRRCGEVMAKAIQGKGSVLISTGSLSNPGLELRRKGFESLLREKYPRIEIVGVFENQNNKDKAQKGVVDALKRYPHLSGVYVTEGGTPGAAAKALYEEKRRIALVAHDLTEETMHWMSQGWITATLGQDPFAQGHDPVIHLYNHLVAGWEPNTRRLLTHMDVVTPENYQQFWHPERGLLQSDEALERLAKPMTNETGKPLSIAVMGREDSAFWTPVKEGALAAKAKLDALRCTVEWIVPDESQLNNNFSARVYGQCMENLITQGINGISTLVSDKALVPMINRAVRSGVPVATFNGEPSSFRGLIYMIAEQADRLMRFSGRMKSTVTEVSGMTGHIQNAVSHIADGAMSQSQEMDKTEANLESLLSTIDQVSKDADESARSAESTTEAVKSGTEAMDKTLAGIQSIEQSVGNTWKTVEDLAGKSERIDAVVDLITDIASRVNVLALNASIEAARAGESGKGFGVVAAEVGKLAKNTADATKEAAKLIRTVKAGIGNARESMVKGLEVVKESALMTDEARVKLGEIRQSIHENRDRIKQIASAIIGIQEFSHSVGQAMRHMASVTTENTQAVNKVDAATRKLNAESQELSKLAETLSAMAGGEQEMLARFNINEEASS